MAKEKKRPEQEGDVTGISHAKGTIPHANIKKGGHPQGIEVGADRDGSPGLRDVNQGSGATSVDMGGGGEGNSIKRRRS